MLCEWPNNEWVNKSHDQETVPRGSLRPTSGSRPAFRACQCAPGGFSTELSRSQGAEIMCWFSGAAKVSSGEIECHFADSEVNWSLCKKKKSISDPSLYIALTLDHWERRCITVLWSWWRNCRRNSSTVLQFSPVEERVAGVQQHQQFSFYH